MFKRTVALLPLLLALPALGATIQVPQDFETIQGAIDSATHGDEIVVATGTYRENIYFNGKNIVLRSTDPTNLDIVKKTILSNIKAGPLGAKQPLFCKKVKSALGGQPISFMPR